jgi:hypothetical protein
VIDTAYRIYKLWQAFKAVYKANEGLNSSALIYIMQLIKAAIKEMEEE